MRRPLLHLLMTIALLLQGVGSAWAATRMASGEVQFAAHVASLPPCHRAAAADAAQDATAGMPCCGTGSCHCVMSCGGTPALGLGAGAGLFAQRSDEPIAEAVSALPRAGHHGPPLRPPATLTV